MKSLIASLPKHISEALQIAESTHLKPSNKHINKVVITGLGGSGIGGTIVADLVADQCKAPIVVNKNYHLPAFVNENTLVIANSYSGNTEETISALEEAMNRNAEIFIVTSGGKAAEIANEKGYNHLVVPGGNPPRSMLGYSLTLQFIVLHHYGLIDDLHLQLDNSATLLSNEQGTIMEMAEQLASEMKGTLPVIYTIDGFEGVAVRLRQQLNENSKMLCWHAVIPEMNHNELVGWENGTDQIYALFLRNASDFDRNQKRVEINKQIIEKHTKNVKEVWSKGNSSIEQAFYHIHLGDWISYYLSELNQVDIMAIDSIDLLKSELAKF